MLNGFLPIFTFQADLYIMLILSHFKSTGKNTGIFKEILGFTQLPDWVRLAFHLHSPNEFHISLS